MISKTKVFDFSKISFNGGLFVKELLARNIKVKFIGDTRVIFAKYAKHEELFYDIHTSLIDYPTSWIINDKYYTKKWLEKNNVVVSPGFFFSLNNQQEAVNYAKEIKFPIVLKPTVGSHGDNVYTNIKTPEELKEKIRTLIEKEGDNRFFLVEKHVSGNEYRIFITKNNFFAAVQRIPASIVGNGVDNILILIQKENFRRMNPRNTCLCEIRLDNITFDFMEQNNITLDQIPKKGEQVFVRGNSNVSTGGNCYDVTDQVHESIRQLSRKILSSFGNIPYIGIDLICENIRKDINETRYIVCELNSAPGLSLHMMPEKGKPRNVVGKIADLLFPETKYGN